MRLYLEIAGDCGRSWEIEGDFGRYWEIVGDTTAYFLIAEREVYFKEISTAPGIVPGRCGGRVRCVGARLSGQGILTFGRAPERMICDPRIAAGRSQAVWISP